MSYHMAPYNAIFDDEYAIRMYDISNERWTFRFRREEFELTPEQAEKAKSVAVMRDVIPPLQIWACEIGKLREIVRP